MALLISDVLDCFLLEEKDECFDADSIYDWFNLTFIIVIVSYFIIELFWYFRRMEITCVLLDSGFALITHDIPFVYVPGIISPVYGRSFDEIHRKL